MCCISEAVNTAANDRFAAMTDGMPETGSRLPELWSQCYFGGTFDRMKQRSHSCQSFVLLL